jgi:hypothetical protein
MARQGRRTPTLDQENGEVRRITERGEAVSQIHHEVALKFRSKAKFREALTILFERNISHSLVGSSTVILSSEHTTVFQPLKPTVSKVLSASDLPPEEIAQLRREHLSFHVAAQLLL